LGRVGIGLHDVGGLPLGHAGEARRRGLGAAEVRDPPARAGKARRALILECAPDALANLLLGVHERDSSRRIVIAGCSEADTARLSARRSGRVLPRGRTVLRESGEGVAGM
jgi:hypothetical protein